MKIKKVNESSYSDFEDSYSMEINTALRQIREMTNHFDNMGEDGGPSEEQYDELEGVLSPYDDNVMETIEHWLFNHVDSNELIRFALDNQDRYGTEPKQLLYAIEDFHRVIMSDVQEVQESTKIKLFEDFIGEKKNYTEGDKRKDSRRIEDMWTKSKDDDHFLRLAQTMANRITNGEKAYNRALAAEDENHHSVAEIFFNRADELGWTP